MFSQPGLTGEDHTRSSDLLAGLGRHFLVETGERGTGDEKGEVQGRNREAKEGRRWDWLPEGWAEFAP